LPATISGKTRSGHSRALVAGMSKRILIIDDDQQLANAYKEYLSQLGHQVDCALEIEEAQTLLTHFSYAVVVTDLRLSKLGFGGLDVIRYIRELALNTRIIVFTGYGWPELRAETAAQEVDAFLRKPAQLAELAETVGDLIGVKQ
jgi:DNA-binding NtrC family response regulator